MTELDCLTPTGREWIAKQHAIIGACKQAFHCDAVTTDDRNGALADVLFYREHTLQAIAEIKARTMTLAELRGHGSYLVTMEKLLIGRELAQRFCVPYLLVVGLSDVIVFWTVADRLGEWQVALQMRRTVTRATCNGGSAHRANAYLDLDTMRRLPE